MTPALPEPPPVAASLASIAHALVARPCSEVTEQALIRTLLDWFAVAVGGSGELPAESLAQGLVITAGPARLVGRVGGADPSVAALVNGTAAHTLELDDIFAPGLFHPGAPIIAAALAAADCTGASGREFGQAVIAGFEVGGRVAVDLGPRHYQHWHTTGTAGAIGAAVAAAHLLGLTECGTMHAIALAATMAGGLQQTFRKDAVGKPLHAGHAAQSGIVAAVAASRGLTGAVDALEGSAGLGPATGVQSAWAMSRSPSPGAPVIEQITVKPYPCCGHAFAPIDAALQLRAAGCPVDDIERIVVTSYGVALQVAGVRRPSTPAEARFSIPHVVSAALLDGEVTRQSFAPGRVDDPRLRRLSATVALATGETFERDFPARRGATVLVTLRDGRTMTQTIRDRSGSPERPMTTEALGRKFTDLVAPILGTDQAAALGTAIRGLSGLAVVAALPVGPRD